MGRIWQPAAARLQAAGCDGGSSVPSATHGLSRVLAFAHAVAVLLLALALVTFQGSAAIWASPARQPAPSTLLTDPLPDPHQPGVRWFRPHGPYIARPFPGLLDPLRRSAAVRLPHNGGVCGARGRDGQGAVGGAV